MALNPPIILQNPELKTSYFNKFTIDEHNVNVICELTNNRLVSGNKDGIINIWNITIGEK